MRLELDVYSAVCETKFFVINGVRASYKDFGDKYDTSPDAAKPFSCGNMIFEPKTAAQQVLDKYNITISEYALICDRLKTCISFGTCRLCA